MLITWKIQCNNIQYTPMKWMHHYLLQIPPHHVIIILVLIHQIRTIPTKNKSNTILSRGIHSKSKHKYRDVFGNANLRYHDFDNGDALTFPDKCTALLQQELQNPYWCLHDPITTKSYQISSKMDIETMPHTMYFSGNKETITKIKKVPYQVIDYDDKGMFQAKMMDNTQVKIFIDNGATPSILPLNMYNKYPILQKYPKMESHTPIHTGGGMIESFLDRDTFEIRESNNLH